MILKDLLGKKKKAQIIKNLNYDQIKSIVPNIDSESFKYSTLDSIRALRLIRAYRVNGHLIADLDPLNIFNKT